MTDKIRLEALTLGEIKHFERVTGHPIQHLDEMLADPGTSMVPMLSALGFIMLRRSGTVLPTDEQIDALTMNQVMDAYELSGVEDPEPLPADAPGSN